MLMKGITLQVIPRREKLLFEYLNQNNLLIIQVGFNINI